MNYIEIQPKLAVVKVRDNHRQLGPQLRIADRDAMVPRDDLRVIHVTPKDLHDLKIVAEEVGQSIEDYISELIEVRMVELRQIKTDAELVEV